MIKILDDGEESPTKSLKEEKAYNEGFAKGYQSGADFALGVLEEITDEIPHKKSGWIDINDQVPEKGRKLLYFFEGTGSWLGFYFGRDEEYPSDNNHVFGGNSGFLTGDVTHWCYTPNYPKQFKEFTSLDEEWAREVENEIRQIKDEDE